MIADECWSDNVPRKLFRNSVHEMSEPGKDEHAFHIGEDVDKLRAERDALRDTVLSIGAQRDNLRAKLDSLKAQLGLRTEQVITIDENGKVNPPQLENLDMRRAMEVAEAWFKGMTDAAELCGDEWYSTIAREKILATRDAKKASEPPAQPATE